MSMPYFIFVFVTVVTLVILNASCEGATDEEVQEMTALFTLSSALHQPIDSGDSSAFTGLSTSSILYGQMNAFSDLKSTDSFMVPVSSLDTIIAVKQYSEVIGNKVAWVGEIAGNQHGKITVVQDLEESGSRSFYANIRYSGVHSESFDSDGFCFPSQGDQAQGYGAELSSGCLNLFRYGEEDDHKGLGCNYLNIPGCRICTLSQEDETAVEQIYPPCEYASTSANFEIRPCPLLQQAGYDVSDDEEDSNTGDDCVALTSSRLLKLEERGMTVPQQQTTSDDDNNRRKLRGGSNNRPQQQDEAFVQQRELTDSGEVIDVMVLYTEASAQANGGANQLESMISMGIAEANTAYLNSEINTKLNLVYTGSIDYTSSGMNQALTALTSSLTEAHGLRDQYGADLVQLITEDDEYCGIGWIMDSPSTDFADHGYSVVYSGCIQSITMAHEFGHNMGMAHDACNADDYAAYAYSYGYRQCGTQNGWATVMAYDCYYCTSSQCSGATQCSGSADRILYFSNPDLTHAGSALGEEGAADNARGLEQAKVYVANFRTSVVDVVTDDETSTTSSSEEEATTTEEEEGGAPTTTAAPAATTTPAPTPACRLDADCDDGLACNGAEACRAGACVAGEAVACPAEGETCAEPTGVCVACDYDGVCGAGETCLSCPEDCEGGRPALGNYWCVGNGQCDSGESCATDAACCLTSTARPTVAPSPMPTTPPPATPAPTLEETEEEDNTPSPTLPLTLAPTPKKTEGSTLAPTLPLTLAPTPIETEEETVGITSEICDDGLDNDHNGFIDCYDEACVGHPSCLPEEETSSTGTEEEETETTTIQPTIEHNTEETETGSTDDHETTESDDSGSTDIEITTTEEEEESTTDSETSELSIVVESIAGWGRWAAQSTRFWYATFRITLNSLVDGMSVNANIQSFPGMKDYSMSCETKYGTCTITTRVFVTVESLELSVTSIEDNDGQLFEITDSDTKIVLRPEEEE